MCVGSEEEVLGKERSNKGCILKLATPRNWKQARLESLGISQSRVRLRGSSLILLVVLPEYDQWYKSLEHLICPTFSNLFPGH